MKKMIVVLLSAFALLSGGDACFAQVSAARHGGVHPGRDRRPEGYSKDSWTVYYRGLKVEGLRLRRSSIWGTATARTTGRCFTAVKR